MFPDAIFPSALFPGPLYYPSGKGIPAVPTGLRATPGAGGVIALAWAPPGSGPAPTGYLLQRSTDSGATWRTIAAPPAPFATDPGLAPGSTGSYRVAASDFDGVSPFSATATASAPPAPRLPKYYPGLFRHRRPRPR